MIKCIIFLDRGDSSFGEKLRLNSDSGADKLVPERGEIDGCKSQDPGGHCRTERSSSELAARKKVAECCGTDLGFWTSQVCLVGLLLSRLNLFKTS